MSDATAPAGSKRVLRRALFVCLGAFLFCFALVPAYRIVCEKVFGTLVPNEAATDATVNALGVDESRWITVEFDGTVNSALQWSFAPKATSMRVHPGQVAEAWFDAANLSRAPLVGQAVPSIAPKLATLYFKKLITLELALQRSSNPDELQELINRGAGVIAGAGMNRPGMQPRPAGGMPPGSRPPMGRPGR